MISFDTAHSFHSCLALRPYYALVIILCQTHESARGRAPPQEAVGPGPRRHPPPVLSQDSANTIPIVPSRPTSAGLNASSTSTAYATRPNWALSRSKSYSPFAIKGNVAIATCILTLAHIHQHKAGCQREPRHIGLCPPL